MFLLTGRRMRSEAHVLPLIYIFFFFFCHVGKSGPKPLPRPTLTRLRITQRLRFFFAKSYSIADLPKILLLTILLFIYYKMFPTSVLFERLIQSECWTQNWESRHNIYNIYVRSILSDTVQDKIMILLKCFFALEWESSMKLIFRVLFCTVSVK